jgi:hypothetical protein
VTNYAGEQPMALTFQSNGEVGVQLGNQERVTLQKAAFLDGAVTGSFGGTIAIPEAKNHEQTLALKVVLVGGELVGQLVAQAVNEDVALMLPSFVRLRSAKEAR